MIRKSSFLPNHNISHPIIPTNSYGEVEKKIKKTINNLQIQSKPNIIAIKQKFDLLRQRLEYWFKDTPSKIMSESQKNECNLGKYIKFKS